MCEINSSCTNALPTLSQTRKQHWKYRAVICLIDMFVRILETLIKPCNLEMILRHETSGRK
jgi:hypothetical protein